MTREEEEYLNAVKQDRRTEWFLKRIGKVVYPSKSSCGCSICVSMQEHGTLIVDKEIAIYLACVEEEESDFFYYDTKEEAQKIKK